MEFGGVEHNTGMGIGGNAKLVERLELLAEEVGGQIWTEERDTREEGVGEGRRETWVLREEWNGKFTP
ncbi:hypothetical protein RHMOL_Rhmol05G0241300 [Rhododendron molle]|uniref:Uncharacterized protein n=1 Tax=Rhododendron molle TaxID=49168 RepID=A0ACC0NTI8_RHOML|nr:hypothetical protein RHMOL_Rhmol05G0241300 [Rhododendron molle]